MAGNIKNIAVSVHQRLLDKARESSRPFNELLQHFAIERFIYRLSRSPQADRFILKGALMFSAWSGPGSRPTMDIDLLGRIDNSLEVIVAAMKDVCEMDVEADGMFFQAETVTAARITEDAEYEGVRVRVQGSLGNARVSLQVDIGFGDVIVPGPSKVAYPTLLDFPAPRVEGLHHGKHHRREVPGHGEARRPEQPDEGFLRHLVAVPHVRLQRGDAIRGD